MRHRLYGASIALGLLLAAVPALAHHSFSAEFDQSRPFTITGVITKVDWVNPHAYLYLDVKDENGKVTPWSFESLPPYMFRRSGLERSMLPVGDTVTVSGFLAKDGTKSLGWIKKLQFADGRVVQVTADNPNQDSK